MSAEAGTRIERELAYVYKDVLEGLRHLEAAGKAWDAARHKYVDAMNAGQYHYSEREGLFAAQDRARKAYEAAEGRLREALRAVPA